MSTQTVWLITGASRGIGLELARQASSSPDAIVFAAVRHPEGATDLKAIKPSGKIHIVKVDTTSEESINAAAKEIEGLLDGKGIDYLLNNAAITAGDDRAFKFDSKALTNCLTTNVVGPALVGQAFVHLVEKSNKKTIVNFTSGLSSLKLDMGPQLSSYSISKTAINMLTYKQAREKKDLIAISLDPGWVQTDMGGPNAWLKVEFSVENIISTVTSLTPEKSGKFFSYKGEEQPW